MPSDAATVAPLHRGVVEPLQTLRWWISTLLFVLTDSPPTSGTDTETSDAAALLQNHLAVDASTNTGGNGASAVEADGDTPTDTGGNGAPAVEADGDTQDVEADGDTQDVAE